MLEASFDCMQECSIDDGLLFQVANCWLISAGTGQARMPDPFSLFSSAACVGPFASRTR